ncbi:MAG: tail fiber domain-containing protein [Bdellovibrionales bacterium]|nr:tail fiber domain-containing protein [Bdellovibrionales bacterium]
MRFKNILSLVASLAGVLIAMHSPLATASNLAQSFNFDGVLVDDATGTPMAGPVSIKFQIFNPAGSCLLFEETHAAVALASDGSFSVLVGSGARSSAAIDGGLSLKTIFQNSGLVRSVDATYCPSAYTPASGDSRKLRTIVNATALTPDFTLSPVPSATVAESLQGKAATDFIAVNTAGGYNVTQANVDTVFSPSNFPSLTALLNGSSTVYMKASDPNGAQLPSVAAAPGSPTAGSIWYNNTTNTLQYYNGSVVNTLSAGGAGTVTSVGFSAPSEFGVTGAPVTSSGTITLTWNTRPANMMFASPDSASGAPTFRALVVNDIPLLPWSKITSAPTTLAGYGIADGVMNGGNTPSIQSGLFAGRPAAGTAGRLYVTTDTLIIYRDNGSSWDAIGSAPTGAAGGDLTGSYPNPVLSASGVTPSTYGTASMIPTFTVDSKGRITLASNVAPAIGVDQLTSGAGKYFNYAPNGTQCAMGETLQWTVMNRWECGVAGAAGAAGGDLSGAYPNPSVSKIQGRTIDPTAPSNGQVLRYNGADWSPINFSIGHLLTTAGTQQFSGSSTCASNQTLTWSSLTDTFTCTSIQISGTQITASSIPTDRIVGYSPSQWTNNASDIYFNTGNVGIGITTPTAPLHSRGSGSVSVIAESLTSKSILKLKNSSGYGDIMLESSPNFNLGFGAATYGVTGSSNTLIGISSGNALTSGSSNTTLGKSALQNASTANYNTSIGENSLANLTSSPNNTAVGYQSGGQIVGGTSNTFLGAGAGYNANGSSSGNVMIGYNSGPATSTGINNQLWIGNAPGVPLIFGDFTNNKIGIGTTTPTHQLHMYNATNSGVRMDASGNSFSMTTSGIGFKIYDENALLDRLNINASGNVGIGTTSPGFKLQVNGTIAPATDNSSNLGDASFRFMNVYAVNGTINTSDARLKNSIENSDLGLNFINRLRPVSYHWNDGSDKALHYGVIAQETQAALEETKRELGHDRIDNVIVTHDEKSDRFGVRYTELISPLIKAVQELFTQLTDQKAELASLKAENAAMKKYLCEKDPSAEFCR